MNRFSLKQETNVNLQNPSVKADCSGIQIGHSYCVNVKDTTPSSTVSSGPTAVPKPSPIQDGVIDTCNSWYFVAKGDTCDKIVQRFGNFTKAAFLQWNPAAGDDCSGLWANAWCCIGVPGYKLSTTTTTSRPSPVQTPPPGNGVQTPASIQPGMVDNCNAFYDVKSGDTCQSIVNKFSNFTLDDFVKWNSGIGGQSCKGLWGDAYACIGLIGHSGSTPTRTITSSSSHPAASSGCQTRHPEPTQSGSVCACKQWYLPADGEYCAAIATKFHISLAQFNSWNPGVGSGCTNLWKGSYVCVSA